jgi:thiamine biosynthesis lipoprotein
MAVALSDARGGTPWSRRALFAGIPLRPRSDGDYWIRVSRVAMACRFEVTLASHDAAAVPAARAALDGVDAVEDQLSIFREHSAVARVNRRAGTEPVPIDGELYDLLARCLELHRDTAGAFDVTTTPISRCWGFLQREGRLPSVGEIHEAMATVGLHRVRLDDASRTITFGTRGVELNFGAIGKGYSLDRVASGMRTAGVSHALLSAGRSSLVAIGGRDGGWHIDVVSPRSGGRLARVWLRNAALGTSGAGEQFFVADGVRYGHVIDPRTGWPASGILSATVIASSGAAADALSTAFLVGGVRLAHTYCDSHPGVMAIITPEGSRRTDLYGLHPGALVEEA